MIKALWAVMSRVVGQPSTRWGSSKGGDQVRVGIATRAEACEDDSRVETRGEEAGRSFERDPECGVEEVEFCLCRCRRTSIHSSTELRSSLVVGKEIGPLRAISTSSDRVLDEGVA